MSITRQQGKACSDIRWTRKQIPRHWTPSREPAGPLPHASPLHYSFSHYSRFYVWNFQAVFPLRFLAFLSSPPMPTTPLTSSSQCYGCFVKGPIYQASRSLLRSTSSTLSLCLQILLSSPLKYPRSMFLPCGDRLGRPSKHCREQTTTFSQ